VPAAAAVATTVRRVMPSVDELSFDMKRLLPGSSTR
jgi:hypothetical protein